jgi:hypothetical protein
MSSYVMSTLASPLEAQHAPSPVCPPFQSRTQEWEWYYVLRKARRLRDAAQALALSMAISSEGMSKTQRPPSLASRKEGRRALPEV